MNKKTLVLTTVALLAILTISMIGTVFAWSWWRRRTTPKVTLRFDLDLYGVPGTGTTKYYRDKARTYGAENTGFVNLTILQWLPLDIPDETGNTHYPAPSVVPFGPVTHQYLDGELEGTVSSYRDRNNWAGIWWATFTCTFDNVDGEVGTFVIKMKCKGVGIIHASEWTGYGTGAFKGITVKGVAVDENIFANMFGLPNEKTCFGIVQRGQYNLPPRNVPETLSP